MSLLFIVSDANRHGGTEILTKNILNTMREEGYDCYLFSLHYYEGTDPKIFSLTKEQYKTFMTIFNSPVNKLLGRKESDQYVKSFVESFVSKNRIDWVINNSHDLIGVLPSVNNVKTAHVFHWSVEGYEDVILRDVDKKNVLIRSVSRWAFNASRKRWSALFPTVDKLVVLTNKAREELLKYSAGVKAEQVVTIPDPLMFTSESATLSTLDNKQLVYVGRLSQEKGVIRLLRIWERLGSRIPDYTLNIYGDGHLRGEMETFIHEHQLKRVVLKGFSSDLESIYTNSDLCLMTSDTEGFGMVLIEAMYYGVPCVAFDCPVSPKEVIADAGVTVPCFDEEAYANAVVALLRDKNRLRDLQIRAVNRAKDFYIDKVIKLWIEMLNSVD